MIEESFSSREIEQIEHLKNTHAFVTEKLEYIKALRRVEADFTKGYKVDEVPMIEIRLFGLKVEDKVRLLDAVNKAVAEEIKLIAHPSAEKIIGALEALYG